MYVTPTSITGYLYVQRVTTIWSKASRGMPAAGLRAQLPDAFALTDAELARLAHNRTYSSILMQEARFTPYRTVEQHNFFLDPHDWGVVAVKFPNNAAAFVRYTYSPFYVGAPIRVGKPPLSCPLGNNELVRVEYNGRSSWPEGAWRYEHTVFNVMLTEQPSAEMFLGEPARVLSDMADLW